VDEAPDSRILPGSPNPTISAEASDDSDGPEDS